MSKSKNKSNNKLPTATKSLKGSNRKISTPKHAVNNRSNQLNPNNSAYEKSRILKSNKSANKK
jgi:hypothetical protein